MFSESPGGLPIGGGSSQGLENTVKMVRRESDRVGFTETNTGSGK
jgi:hypothetical protein